MVIFSEYNMINGQFLKIIFLEIRKEVKPARSVSIYSPREILYSFLSASQLS